MSRDILVLGGGPAGATVALGLQGLDYDVSVISEQRSYPVIEGISARVYQALQQRGLQQALQTVSQPVRRYALWNEDVRDVNTESLLDRPAFDAALMADLREAGIPVLEQRIHSLQEGEDGWVVECSSGSNRQTFRADFVVEARGRTASLANTARQRGPETVSIGCCWISHADQPFTVAASTEQGWLWLARSEEGKLFAQFTTHAKNPSLPVKDGIPCLLDQMLQQLDVPGIVLENRKPVGDALARSSTPILAQNTTGDNYLRVGDAAMAVDPLSGNGIFQSLSSALVAPAVINTVLKRPGDAAMATGFYQQRLEQLFWRFARTGRDFYQLESRWQDSPFWESRRAWPDANPAHRQPDHVIGSAQRPVVNNGFIEQHTVVITEDQPLGIWQVGDRKATDVLI